MSVGCGASEAPFEKAEVETRPPAKTPASADATIDYEEVERIVVFSGEYSITVTGTKRNKQVCAGTFVGRLWSDQVFTPEGSMDCGVGGEIDLAEVFPTARSESMPAYPGYGEIVRATNEEGKTYDPPRPIGFPVIQDHYEFEGYSIEDATTLSMTSSEGEDLSASGTLKLSMDGIDQAWTNGVYSFDNVYHYTTSSEGFEEIPRSESKLEIRRQTWANSYPIALLQVRIDSTLKDQFPGLIGSFGGIILGPIIIELKLIKPHIESD